MVFRGDFCGVLASTVMDSQVLKWPGVWSDFVVILA